MQKLVYIICYPIECENIWSKEKEKEYKTIKDFLDNENLDTIQKYFIIDVKYKNPFDWVLYGNKDYCEKPLNEIFNDLKGD